MMNKGDAKRIAVTVVGAVVAAYTIKFLKKQGWL
ncbi:hypothetical protein VSWAT3_00658 [Vibrionales bacterium SWAT-3]|nr:hypothetical protein VSWAT3_00658 [Vibrionales bacterium SWAT-3]